MIFGSWRHAKSSYSLPGSGIANIPYDYNIIGLPISIARIILGKINYITLHCIDWLIGWLVD